MLKVHCFLLSWWIFLCLADTVPIPCIDNVPVQQLTDRISCKVKIDTSQIYTKAWTVCNVQQNGENLTLVANISSTGYKQECNVNNSVIMCCLENVQSLEKDYNIAVGSYKDVPCGDGYASETIKFSPFDLVQPSELTLNTRRVSSKAVRFTVELPEEIIHYTPLIESWILKVTYFLTDSPQLNQTYKLAETEIDEKIKVKIGGLHAYRNYTFLVEWKFTDYKFWSEPTTYTITTKIGVPHRAPYVPKKNYAHGVNSTAVYIQKQPDEADNGPIIYYYVNVTTNENPGKKVGRNLPIVKSTRFNGDKVSLIVPLEADVQDYTITVQSATSAGLSLKFTTINVSPQEYKVDEQLKRIESVKYNDTHDELWIDDVTGADKIYIFWCWGNYLSSKELVECESSIQFKKINDFTRKILIPTPQKINANCKRCNLHYAVTMKINNVSSSMLWDSTSEPNVGELVQANLKSPKYLNENLYWILPVAAIVIISILMVFVSLKCRRYMKLRYPIHGLDYFENTTMDRAETPTISSYRSSGSLQGSTKKLLSSDNGDSLLTASYTGSSNPSTGMNSDDIMVTTNETIISSGVNSSYDTSQTSSLNNDCIIDVDTDG